MNSGVIVTPEANFKIYKIKIVKFKKGIGMK